MLPMPYRIKRTDRDTHDVFSLQLQSVDDRPALSFAPGQFNMLYVFGVGEVPISISGDPTHPENLVHTIRSTGTVTKALRQLKRGDTLGVRGPFGTPWPVAQSAGKDILLIAGGIGMAPLRPAVLQLLAEKEKYGKIILFYGARTPQDLLFIQEIEGWQKDHGLEAHITVDVGQPGWKGNVGVVTRMISKIPFDPNNSISMICGPELMMRFSVMELKVNGQWPEQIYISMERNMKCAVGFCGHCQFGPHFLCKDGPVFPYETLKSLIGNREF